MPDATPDPEVTDEPEPSSERGFRDRVLTRAQATRVVVMVAVVTALADQATKAWALSALDGDRTINILGRWLNLHLVHNSGAAFSLGQSRTWVMTGVALIIVAVVIGSISKVRSQQWSVLIGLILGGAVGNLIDRFIRPPGPGRGAVVDFIDYGGFFVGNVADIAIVGAAIGIGLLTVAGVPYGKATS